MPVNRFGRLVAPPDARDLSFRMRPAMLQIRKVAKPTPRTHAYRDGPLLDQGDTPHCVGYSARGFLDGAPLMLAPKRDPSAVAIYHGAQERDEWPGTNYDGTSVRGALKYLCALGHIQSYVWGQTVDTAIAWMNGGYGTCLVGTNWYAEMSEVDDHGFLREPPSNLSTPIGGHAWRWIWWDATKQAILLRNSWGHAFGWSLRTGGRSGYAYLRLPFAERLLKEDGDLASPTQITIAAEVPT